MNKPPSVRITEIFHSLQGEAKTAGIPTVFVRLTGCPLRCQYCDTAYAFEGGTVQDLEAIVAAVQGFNCSHVTVTGGEPLAQPGCIELLHRLAELQFEVSLETSGAMPIDDVDARVSIVLDLKTPGSLEEGRNRYENLALLKPKDQIKFVLCDRRDYLWARSKMLEFDLQNRVGEVLLSPSFEELAARDLAEWVLEDALRVRVQLQLHKLLWGSEPGR